MKLSLFIASALVSFNSIAQPFVLNCDLDWKYVRDGVIEQDKTGIWCRSCKVAITIEDKYKLRIDSVTPEFGYFYNTNNKVELDSNGFATPGVWSIDSQTISAQNKLIRFSKEAGSRYLKINRLTGHFYASSTSPNPIGKGNIEETLTGTCQAAKAAF
jgi:hypothetical protein